jgi:hypothetical protein
MQVADVVKSKSKEPTIVNSKSNFVVCTYWWGRGNKNANTGRPCTILYEKIITGIKKSILSLFRDMKLDFTEDKKAQARTMMEEEYKTSPPFLAMVERETRRYKTELTKSQRDGLTTVVKSPEEIRDTLLSLAYYCVSMIKDDLIELYILYLHTQKHQLMMKSIPDEDESQGEVKQLLNARIKAGNARKNEMDAEIMKKLKVKMDHPPPFDAHPNTNFFDLLNLHFMYLQPILYNEMIDKWETECARTNCNFLCIEYPEFAAPGGYQLAINAKPDFIQHALALCKPRNVVYIDGDMYVRKYPHIFDRKDVDFMARGWSIDPRASEELNTSISYDPYTFETSGGIMFFSQSLESDRLLRLWITETRKPGNRGKADDRILSFFFNTKKLLCCMKIIQLPIEYLWLSLAYDFMLLDELYDSDVAHMKQTIFVEHPECLTSEDTATSSGAACNREPKGYWDFMEQCRSAVSEEMHEFILFPEDKGEFKDYFKFMSGKQYIDDGNKALVDKGFVHPGNPADNEQPLYVFSNAQRFGEKPHRSDETKTNNQVYAENYEVIPSIVIRSLLIDENNIIIVPPVGPLETIHIILKILSKGQYALYNPKSSLTAKLMANLGLYKHLELVFAPILKEEFNDFYKPAINLDQCILFNPNSAILKKFLLRCLSLEDLSFYLSLGSYEFMSTVRVGYLFDRRGGFRGGTLTDDIRNYEEGITLLYGRTGGTRRKNKTRRRKSRYLKRGFHLH